MSKLQQWNLFDLNLCSRITSFTVQSIPVFFIAPCICMSPQTCGLAGRARGEAVPKASEFTVIIDRFRYIKIQHKTTDLSTRLWGITTEFVGFIPQSLVLRSIVLG